MANILSNNNIFLLEGDGQPGLLGFTGPTGSLAIDKESGQIWIETIGGSTSGWVQLGYAQLDVFEYGPSGSLSIQAIGHGGTSSQDYAFSIGKNINGGTASIVGGTANWAAAPAIKATVGGTTLTVPGVDVTEEILASDVIWGSNFNNVTLAWGINSVVGATFTGGTSIIELTDTVDFSGQVTVVTTLTNPLIFNGNLDTEDENSFVSGEANSLGYTRNCIVAGSYNRVSLSEDSIVLGYGNFNVGSWSAIFGKNINLGSSNLMSGGFGAKVDSPNYAGSKSSYNIIVGAGNHLDKGAGSLVVGEGNQTANNFQTALGTKNKTYLSNGYLSTLSLGTLNFSSTYGDIESEFDQFALVISSSGSGVYPILGSTFNGTFTTLTLDTTDSIPNAATIPWAFGQITSDYTELTGDSIAGSGLGSFVQGSESLSLSDSSQALGFENIAVGLYSFANGYRTLSTGFSSFSTGYGTVADGNQSFAIGRNVYTEGDYAFIGGKGIEMAPGSTFPYSDTIWSKGQSSFTFFELETQGKYKGTANNSVVLGGYDHAGIVDKHSGIFVGTGNEIRGPYSAIIGGSNNSNTGSRSVILGGTGIAGSENDHVYTPSLEVGGTARMQQKIQKTGLIQTSGDTNPDISNASVWSIVVTGATTINQCILPDGVDGQRLTAYVSEPGTGFGIAISPATFLSTWSKINLVARGSSVDLIWNSNGWVVVGGSEFTLS